MAHVHVILVYGRALLWHFCMPTFLWHASMRLGGVVCCKAIVHHVSLPASCVQQYSYNKKRVLLNKMTFLASICTMGCFWG